MAHLIDKDALVAEIERMKVDAIQFPFEEYGTNGTCSKLLSFLDTLEVKEVDLEKEMVEWHRQHFKKEGTFDRHSGFYLANNSQLDLAKHFFELGLKVNNEKKK